MCHWSQCQCVVARTMSRSSKNIDLEKLKFSLTTRYQYVFHLAEEKLYREASSRW